MKKLIIILSIILLSISVCKSQSKSEILDKGDSFLYTNLDSVLFYANKGLEITKPHSCSALYFQLLKLDGYILRHKLNEADSLLQLLDRYESNEALDIQILSEKATIHVYKQNIDSAIYYFHIAIKSAELNNNFPVAAEFKANLSTLYLTIGDTDNALRLAHEVEPFFERNGDLRKSATINMNIGIMYSDSGEFVKGIKYLEKSLSQSSDDMTKATILHNLAICNEEMGNLHEAMELYEETIQLNNSLDRSSIIISDVYLNKGTCERKLNKFVEAEQSIKYGMSFSDGPDSLQNKVIGFTELINLYEKKGEYKKALDYSKLLKQSTEQLQINKTKSYADSLRLKFNVEKKELENLNLKSEKILREGIIKKQTEYMKIGSAGLLVVSFLLFLLFRQKNKQKKLNIYLSAQRDQIKILNQELNHRVKNNLAFITSLLEMQSRRSETDETKIMLEESRNRLKALSLVHNNLFKNENDAEINLKVYLEEIIIHLQKVYALPDKRLTIKSVLTDHVTDAENAMRIGLIINELITNSIKHAFTNVDKPKIEITTSQEDNGKISINYWDNGLGNHQENHTQNQTSGSMGTKLISLLAKQLEDSVVLKIA